MSSSSTANQRPAGSELSGPGSHLPDEKADLNTQIHAAELAVIKRDESVRYGVRQITDRLREHAGIGLAAGAGIMLFILGRARHRAAGEPATVSTGGGRGMLYAVESLWPMLPGSLRKLVPPGIPELLFGIVLPTFRRLFPGRQAPAGATEAAKPQSPVRSAEYIDLRRYLGRWYEIARLPTSYQKRCVSDVTASYGVIGKRGPLAVVNQCRQADGRMRAASGVARVVDGRSNARLKVSFAPRLLRWLPWLWGDYWILMVDADYRYALVGTPDRRSLWLLSRTPSLADADWERLIACARAQAYDTAALKRTVHRQ